MKKWCSICTILLLLLSGCSGNSILSKEKVAYERVTPVSEEEVKLDFEGMVQTSQKRKYESSYPDAFYFLPEHKVSKSNLIHFQIIELDTRNDTFYYVYQCKTADGMESVFLSYQFKSKISTVLFREKSAVLAEAPTLFACKWQDNEFLVYYNYFIYIVEKNGTKIKEYRTQEVLNVLGKSWEFKENKDAPPGYLLGPLDYLEVTGMMENVNYEENQNCILLTLQGHYRKKDGTDPYDRVRKLDEIYGVNTTMDNIAQADDAIIDFNSKLDLSTPVVTEEEMSLEENQKLVEEGEDADTAWEIERDNAYNAAYQEAFYYTKEIWVNLYYEDVKDKGYYLNMDNEIAMNIPGVPADFPEHTLAQYLEEWGERYTNPKLMPQDLRIESEPGMVWNPKDAKSFSGQFENGKYRVDYNNKFIVNLKKSFLYGGVELTEDTFQRELRNIVWEKDILVPVEIEENSGESDGIGVTGGLDESGRTGETGDLDEAGGINDTNEVREVGAGSETVYETITVREEGAITTRINLSFSAGSYILRYEEMASPEFCFEKAGSVIPFYITKVGQVENAAARFGLRQPDNTFRRLTIQYSPYEELISHGTVMSQYYGGVNWFANASHLYLVFDEGNFGNYYPQNTKIKKYSIEALYSTLYKGEEGEVEVEIPLQQENLVSGLSEAAFFLDNSLYVSSIDFGLFLWGENSLSLVDKNLGLYHMWKDSASNSWGIGFEREKFDYVYGDLPFAKIIPLKL